MGGLREGFHGAALTKREKKGRGPFQVIGNRLGTCTLGPPPAWSGGRREEPKRGEKMFQFGAWRT